jgi:hypothetical protein
MRNSEWPPARPRRRRRARGAGRSRDIVRTLKRSHVKRSTPPSGGREQPRRRALKDPSRTGAMMTPSLVRNGGGPFRSARSALVARTAQGDPSSSWRTRKGPPSDIPPGGTGSECRGRLQVYRTAAALERARTCHLDQTLGSRRRQVRARTSSKRASSCSARAASTAPVAASSAEGSLTWSPPGRYWLPSSWRRVRSQGSRSDRPQAGSPLTPDASPATDLWERPGGDQATVAPPARCH